MAQSAQSNGPDSRCSSITLAGPGATAALADWLAPQLRPGDELLLDGPLGAGKTTLVRQLVAALGGDADQVASPTFTLLHRYDARLPVVHVDAYRLAQADELSDLGYEELRQEAVACVEWSERAAELFDRTACWCCALDHLDPDHRLARLRPPQGRSLAAWPATGPLAAGAAAP